MKQKLKVLIFQPTVVFIFFLAAPAGAVTIVDIEFLFAISHNFSEPSDVTVLKDGRIFVVDGVNNRIKVFKSDGRPLLVFGEKGNGNGQFQYPLGIDADNDGNIYVADAGNNRIQIFDSNGGYAAKIDLPAKNGTPSDPTDVAVDDTRKRLYVVDNDNHRFFEYDLMTLRQIKVVGSAGEQELMFRYPFMAALNKDQYLYVVDVINTRVQVISPEGHFVANVGGWGVEKGRFFRPKGVAVDKDGRVFVSDSYMGVIQVFGAWGEFYGVLGDGQAQTVKKFNTPAGLFMDDDNRLYIVEMLAQRVSVYAINAKR